MYPLDYQVTLERVIRARLEALSAEDPSAEAYSLRGALERLHARQIGTCTCCGEEIPYWLLVSEPSTMSCGACREPA